MNKDILAGKWKQVKGKVRDWWGDVTDDDVAQINGKFETFVGVLQERYGYTRAQAKAAWNEFVLRYVDGHTVKRQVCPAHPGTLMNGRISHRGQNQPGWQLHSRCAHRRKARF